MPPPDSPTAEFPLRDEVEDFAGRKMVFVIDCDESAAGYSVTAVEEGKDHFGYEFSGYSETSPWGALGMVRRKMARALATRHLIKREKGAQYPLHDTLRGRITSRDGEPVFVIDGIPLSLEQLGKALLGCEGWDFRIDLIDSCSEAAP
jgi:hypothetical protein